MKGCADPHVGATTSISRLRGAKSWRRGGAEGQVARHPGTGRVVAAGGNLDELA
jgi:hypothetical protein